MCVESSVIAATNGIGEQEALDRQRQAHPRVGATRTMPRNAVWQRKQRKSAEEARLRGAARPDEARGSTGRAGRPDPGAAACGLQSARRASFAKARRGRHG